MDKLADYIRALVALSRKALAWLVMATIYQATKRWSIFLLERKVKEANRKKNLYKRRYIVYVKNGRPVCEAKRDIKDALARRAIKMKGRFKYQDIESNAYYITD